MRRLALGLAALTIALAGCRTLPPPVRLVPDPVARRALVSLADWHAIGRVAVRSGSEGFSASFDWREVDGRGELGVRGPFGAGAVHISLTDERIQIESGKEASIDVNAPFDTLDPVLTAHLGFPLPLASLRYWLLGVPAPGVPSDGSGAEFEQAGWHVAVTAFVTVPGGPGPLPARLVLTRAATRIRVIVDRWTLVGA